MAKFADSIGALVMLNGGVPMPWLGLGVFRTAAATETAVAAALACGYRSIDTAAVYGNEAEVGRAVRRSGIPRKELFITTKLWNSEHGRIAAMAALDASLRRLGMDHLDLYLVHWPVRGPTLVETWLALNDAVAVGKARAIGVSNFTVADLELILAAGRVVPAVNQVEFHPFLQQRPLHDFCRAHGIQLQAWAPLVRGQANDHPVIAAIAVKHGRTPAQVLLRWDVQREVVTIPKSANPERIRENADIFGFILDAEDMARLDGLDEGRRIGPDPENFNF